MVFLATTLTLTFMQPAFTTAVSVSILFFHTRSFPVYLYVLAALIAGVCIGFFPVFFLFIQATRLASRRRKRIGELEGALESAEKKAAAEEAIRSLSEHSTHGRLQDRG
jgi:uncharacterized integral membrane protein